MMHERGKSDSAVGAVKPANKAERSAAELVEQRAGTKGNADQQSTRRAQDRASVSQALERIRQAAKQRKKEKFTALFHHISDELLRLSFFALKKDAAPGVDGLTWQDYESDLDRKIEDLHDRVQRGAYRALPSRRQYLPKPDGRQRPIAIAALEDKIVQRATAAVLNTIYEEDFLGFSYGFRPKRSQHDALDALVVGITSTKVNWILEVDVRSFFDEVSQSWLTRFLEHRIADPRILHLIQKWLKAGILEDGVVTVSDKGTGQGSVISPILSNLFLHYTFDMWMRRNHPAIPFERYADDAICHCRSEGEARTLRASLEKRFAECGLTLHPDKTKIVYCKDDDRRGDHPDHKFDFLGYTFRPRLSRRRNGFGVSFSPAVSGKALKSIRQTVRHWTLHERSDKTLDDLARMFNNHIRGWINYYGRFYKSALYPALRHIDRILARWVHRKFKSLRRHKRRTHHWLERVVRRQPDLFAHWKLLYGRGRTMGAG